MTDTVRITIEGPSKNALGSELMESITARFEAAGDAPVILTGSGDSFSAGLDLAEVEALGLEEGEAFLRRLERLIRTVFLHPGPTCAIINGHAIAGGCILALACDLRVATYNEKARIGLNEVALGLRFPPSLLGMLRTRLPPEHLETVLLEAGLHDPEDALLLGLVDAVTEAPEKWAAAGIARRCKSPRSAYTAAKLALRAPSMAITSEQDAAFVRDVLPTWVSPELKAKLRKFLGR
jgi:enoyl-CoA hydratase